MYFKANLDIARIKICLKSPNEGIVKRICNYAVLRDFISYSTKKRPDINLTFFINKELPRPKKTALLFDCKLGNHTYWQLHRSASGNLLRCYSYGKWFNNLSCLNNDFSKGTIYIKKDRSIEKIKYGPPKDSETEILELLLSGILPNIFYSYLTKNNMMCVHASGVKTEKEKVYLFIGPSSAGKSTIARILQKVKGLRVLNDDRIIIRGRGKYFAYSNPWPGTGNLYFKGAGVIKGIFFIKKSKDNKISSINRKTAFLTLFNNSFCRYWDKSALVNIVNLCNKIIDTVSCERLSFARSKNLKNFLTHYF